MYTGSEVDGEDGVGVDPKVTSLVGAGPLLFVDIWHPDAVKHTHSAVTIATFLIPRFSRMGGQHTVATEGITGVCFRLGGKTNNTWP